MSKDVLILAACATLLSGASERTPLEVVEAFFSPKGIRNKREIYTGEMLSFLNERTIGEYAGKKAKKTYRPLYSSATDVAFAIEVSTGEQVTDWYAFVHNEDGQWRLQAIRSLDLSGTVGNRNLADRADADWGRRNGELLVASDTQLREYLRSHLAEFNALAAATSRQENVDPTARELLLSAVRPAKTGQGIECIIGGVLDKAVGYLYLPDGASPPPMSPFAVMYIEQVTANWYVFKTN